MADDDYTVQSYQDDLDDNNRPDPFADEQAENPAGELGVPVSEFKQELDKEVADEDENLNGDNVDIEDDQRESVEAQDEDPDDRGY